MNPITRQQRVLHLFLGYYIVLYNVLLIVLGRIKITSVLAPLKQLEVKNFSPEFKTSKFLGAFVFGGGIFLGGVILTVGYILSNIARENWPLPVAIWHLH